MIKAMLIIVAVAIVIAIIQNAIKKSQIKSGAIKLCPHCREEIPGDASVCKTCHRDLTPAA